jgi:tetratricopeptide (TPR) repeat protein
MICKIASASCSSKAITISLLLSFSLLILSPTDATAQTGADTTAQSENQNENIYERFEKVSSLRSQGQYDQAIEILKGIITEFTKADEVLRRAYSDLVFTLMSKQDLDGATESAREALARYPDLTADPVYFPPRVNELYGNLRSQMYGSLFVATKPESCRVFLGKAFIGVSPLNVKYVKVGGYTLNMSKSGYKDESSPVRIEPGSPTSMQLSLQKEHGKKWWLMRAGPVAALASVLAYFQLTGEEGTAQAEPLPGPPSTPSQ